MHKNLLLFCIALILCGFSYAEIKEIKGYSLGKCFLETVSRSESLAYEEEKVVQAEEQYSQALSLLFPKLGGSLSYSRSDASVTPAPDSTTFKLTASQSLFNGFRVLNAFNKSGLQLSNQKLAYDWAYSLLYTDLSQSFFLVLYLEKEKQLLEEQSQIFEKRLRELKERLRVGRSRSTEVPSFEISMALLKTQIVQLKMQTDTARNYFSFISGLDKSTKLIEKDKEVLPTLKSFAEYKKRIELRPDVLASKEAIRIASVAVEIAEIGRAHV